jgi:hypothetical protein
MRGMGSTSGEECPIKINLDPETFKPGDLVSYRVPEAFGDTPFVGQLVSVHEEHVVLQHWTGEDEMGDIMKATRQSRPMVRQEDAFDEA